MRCFHTPVAGIALVLTLATVASLHPSTAAAQTRSLVINPGSEIFLLKELGAVISDSDSGLTVLMVLPAEQRGTAYKNVDLREGDRVLMLNGKLMQSPGHLEKTYDQLAAGDELKLGIRRGRDMLIEALVKANPDDLPQQMMVKTCGDNPVSASLADAGLILKELNDKIVIDDVIPDLVKNFTGSKPEKGDIILKVQGSAVSAGEQVPEIYSAIRSGDRVELVLERQGREISSGFIKPGCGAAKPTIIKK